MLNIEQKTILLLNISPSDAGNLTSFISDSVSFITVSDIPSAIETLSSTHVDMIFTDGHMRSAFLRSISDHSEFSGIPVLSVERSFASSAANDTETLKSSLFDSGALFNVLKSIYQLVVTCNFSKDTCEIIQHLDYSKDIDINVTVFSELVNNSAAIAAPCHRCNLTNALDAGKLCESIKNGEDTVCITYRSLGNDNCWHWFETIVLNIENPYDDDVLALVLSRSVDEQKLLEERLLKSLDETTEALEKNRYYEQFAYEAMPAAIVMYYLDWRPLAYMNGNLFLIFGYSTEEVMEMHKTGFRGIIPEEDMKTANAVVSKAAREGVDRVTNEYRMYKKDGSIARVHEIASRFTDEDGSVGFISVFTDVTERYEMLNKIRRNDIIMSMVVEHSERIVYYYDIAKDELRAINVEVAMRSGLADFCVDPVATLSDLSLIKGESIDLLRGFIDTIRNGEPHGSLKLNMTCLDGNDRWFDISFSAMPDESDYSGGAVISMLDITDQHDREISHARYRLSLDNALSNKSILFEIDLTSNTVEKQFGVISPFVNSYIDKPYTDAASYLVKFIHKRKNQRRVQSYLSTEALLEAYNSDQRRISDDWPIQLDNGNMIWMHCSVQLVNDPYTGHTKMHMALSDVTEAKQMQLNILHRAENDGLTGLYNRSTIERKIEESLKNDYHRSAFILIDLDDLKRLNDRLGHAQGDRAICAISDELVSTFKPIGIEGRLGGDEFLVFVPNMSDDCDLDKILSGLLRRLTSISIGENNDTAIHCSIGVSIADESAHDFASLYKRADIALYHVKRNGKNDYTFFTEEMLLADYKYRSYEFSSISSSPLFDNIEFRRIITSLSNFYPQILLSNLTKNALYVLHATEGYGSKLPNSGNIDLFIDIANTYIHGDNAMDIVPKITRESLLSMYEQGKDYLYGYCRLSDKENGSSKWIAYILLFYKNADGDVCELALIRPANEKSLQVNAVIMQKALELSLSSGIDFACSVNAVSGRYELISGKCKAEAGSFDDFASLCGCSLDEIRNSLVSENRFVCAFGTEGKKAVFSFCDDLKEDIVMVVFDS